MSEPSILTRLFPALTEEDVGTMMTHARRAVYPPGTSLCHEGRIEDTFYVIEEGRAEVFIQISSDENLSIKELGPGDCFGEMALVADQPRSATVRTLSSCRVLEIDKHTLEAVLMNNRRILLGLMRRISRNFWDNDRRTIEAMQRKNAALARAYADLEAQQTMRTEFITTLSHELRTPLTSAQGYLHLINAGAIPADQQARVLASVTRNVEQVVAITNSLIILHEMDLIAPRIAPVDLRPLVGRVIQEVTRYRDKPETAVINQVPATFEPVHADSAGLELSLRSLVDNAVKFGSDDSPVVVTAQTAEAEIVIQVIDQGIGMSEETLEHVFEPYYRAERTTADRLFDGLGIGLAIARFIIERHGGRISVSSRLGQGSTFTVHLLRQPEPTGLD